jgi:hypothetical protein
MVGEEPDVGIEYMEKTAWFLPRVGQARVRFHSRFSEETTIPQKPATDEEDPEFGWTLQSRLPHLTPTLPS